MAGRNVYGNSFSSNGWPMVDTGSCTWVNVPGTSVTLQIQNGWPLAILRAFAADFNAYVEPLRDADSACWTSTNSVSTSNHLSGTAMDLNWDSHPFQVPDAGFDSAKITAVEEIQDFYEGTVFWGNDWSNPKDAMHFQLSSLANGGDINTYNNPAVGDFIARKIRADGFSTFRRGTAPPPAPGLTAQNLSDAMGGAVSLDRYAQLLPAYRQACQEAGLSGNLNRLAMFAAQLGEESGGFKWMEEIASGAAYEGRTDLGNTQPGDGVRFKGRGAIMVTGRSNYSQLSQWAFGKGYVPSPTFFVDNPTQLSTDQYGFLGPVWYWTVARPQINSLCDAGDIVGVTKAINGGTNGLQDRTNRWNHCLAMGLAELDVQGSTTPGDDMAAVPQDQWDRVYRELTQKLPSRSPLRHLDQTQYYPGGLVDTMAGMVLNTDGSEHVQYVSLLANYGHPGTLALLREVAGADPAQYPDRQDDAKLAQAILAEATAAPVSFAPVDTTPIAAPQPQVVYLPAPTPTVVESSGSTGQLIGNAYDAAKALLASPDMDDAEKAAATNLISVLQTKTGAAS